MLWDSFLCVSHTHSNVMTLVLVHVIWSKRHQEATLTEELIFFFILKRDSWWVLPPLPAAAFSSHQESAEYSKQKFRAVWSNLGWSLGTRKRCRLLVPAWSAVGNTSEYRASFLHKRYLEKPAPDPPRSVPLAPACRGELTVLPAPPFSPQCSPVCDCSTPESSCKAPVPKWNKLCYGKRKSGFGHWFYTASTNHGLFL